MAVDADADVGGACGIAVDDAVVSAVVVLMECCPCSDAAVDAVVGVERWRGSFGVVLGRSCVVDVVRGPWDELPVLCVAAGAVRSWEEVRLSVGERESFSPSNPGIWEMISRRR